MAVVSASGVYLVSSGQTYTPLAFRSAISTALLTIDGPKVWSEGDGALESDLEK